MISDFWNWEKVKNTEYWKNPAKEIYAYLYYWSLQQSGKELLDLGAGMGRHSLLFAKNEFNVTALDSSTSSIDIILSDSKKLGVKVNTVHGDMKLLPFEDRRFNFLIAYNAVYHSEDAGIKDIINEIYRVLQPGGEIFITLLSKEDESFLENIENQISENTLLKSEQDGSVLPHFFVDKNMIPKLFNKFKINSICQLKEFYENKSSTHYNVHLVKEGG